MADVTAKIASFLEPRGKAHHAKLIASAFGAAGYPEAEWVEALIAMSAETLQELVAAVEAEAAQALPEPEPEPEPQPPSGGGFAGDNSLLQMSFGGAPPAAAALPDPFGLDLLGAAPPLPQAVPALGFDLLGGFPAAAAAAPPVDLLAAGAGPPPIAQPDAAFLSDISDGEGGRVGAPIAMPPAQPTPPPAGALGEPVFTLVCFPSELVGSKPRRVYVKAIGGTFTGLRESLQDRFALKRMNFCI